MDPNGDITDAFDDDALAQSIEAGKSGPWNESAEFEDPRLTQVTKELVVPKPTDYQQRRMKELQERAARKEASGTTAAAPAAPNADVWGEQPTSTFDGEDSPSSEQWQDDSAAFAEPEATPPAAAPTPRVKGPVARPATPDAKSAPAPTATAPGNARVWLIAVAVIAAAAVGYWLTTGA